MSNHLGFQLEARDRATMWGSFGLISFCIILQSISSVDGGPYSLSPLVPICELTTQEGRVQAQQLWKHVSLASGKVVIANVTRRTGALRQSLRPLPSNKVTRECRTIFRCVCWRWERVQREGKNRTPSHLAIPILGCTFSHEGFCDSRFFISTSSHVCGFCVFAVFISHIVKFSFVVFITRLPVASGRESGEWVTIKIHSHFAAPIV